MVAAMIAAAPAAMAAVEPDQAALDALVRARLAEEAGNPAEALAASLIETRGEA